MNSMLHRMEKQSICILVMLLIGFQFAVYLENQFDGIHSCHEAKSTKPSYTYSFPERSPVLAEESYNKSSPIIIGSNSDFVLQAYPGNGTAENPFVIANLRIESNNNCLRVENTTAHFVMRDCELIGSVYLKGVENGAIQNCTIDSTSYGIEMNETKACSITSCSIVDCSWVGVYVSNSNDCIFSGNDLNGIGRAVQVTDADFVWHQGEAIEIRNCTDCTVSYNQLVDNTHATAIHLSGSRDCDLQNNHIIRDYRGIGIGLSQRIRVRDNLLVNCSYYGLDFYDSTSCAIVNNTFENCGIEITGSLPHYVHDFHGNDVNGKEFGYFLTKSHESIDGARYGQIFLINSTSTTLDGGDFHTTKIPVNIVYSTNCTVQEIQAYGATWASLLILQSTGCRVLDSTFADSYHGLEIELSSNCVIRSNHIANNTLQGLFLSQSNRCGVIDNTIEGNGGWGILNEGSNHNTFYGNVLARNARGNAWDWNSFNSWDNGIGRGNSWDDYIGIGPYYIPGNIFTFDWHPRSVNGHAERYILIIVIIGAGLIGTTYFAKRRRKRTTTSQMDD
ncbi:MAG: hypothetical protein GF309_15960 [Candidatus Lokiarchaeota archaeon]|nr:hypothetical protein [Candidatus Lokiarchaeota archaeon]